MSEPSSEPSATVPFSVVHRHTPTAIAAYAVIDMHDGRVTIREVAEILGMSAGSASRAIKELCQYGSVAKVANGRYALANKRSTLFQQAQTRTATRKPRGYQQGKAPTTTSEVKGEPRKGNEPSGSEGAIVSEGDTGPSEIERSASLAQPPPAKRIDGRDLGFDALSECCNADPRSRSGEIVKALKQIRRWVWDDVVSGNVCIRGVLLTPEDAIANPEDFERCIVASVEWRARLYRERMSGAILTPTALARWWFDLVKLAEPPLTPTQIASGEW